jgi:hypothetical protein
MPDSPSFRGEIKVASRIVDYLSSGLYKSPAACLKELINNSYDADATRVDVFVKPDADRIIIEDDGHGMDRADFERHFQVISQSLKREDGELTPSGRPKIGKIGIGFIAANEICDVMELVSTRAGSTELLEVTIQFELMRQDLPDRRRQGSAIAKADYIGTVSQTDSESHFTQVFLKSIRGEARAILSGRGTSEYASGSGSLYGLTAETVLGRIRDQGLRSWSIFDAYSRNALEVGLNVPVAYHKGWLPAGLRSKASEFEKEAERLSFAVFIDGTEIRKPIAFAPGGKALVDRFGHDGQHVSARGYFYAQHGAIRPQELQGVLVRIRHAAVGDYDQGFLGFSSSIGPLFQTWISAEVMADDRLEEAMNIDRRTLRVAHPAYVELQRAVHAHLAALIKRMRIEIYGAATRDRADARVKIMKDRIAEVASQEIASIAPAAAKELTASWARVAQDSTSRSKLLRKYSVDELYALVIETAAEVMSQAQLGRFLRRLTERLQE